MTLNYTVFHLHDDTSNCNGYADSVTKYGEYIKLAKKCKMNAIAFSNHGGIYDWVKKKIECDKAGIKYIHGVELYLCEKLQDNHRGWHIGLYAKNLQGVIELNSLMSKSTSKGIKEDKSDRHFYNNPRISFEELMSTSDNILITTACLASALWKLGKNKESVVIEDEKEYSRQINVRDALLKWLSKNKHRCFLEIQYHNCEHQKEYNKQLYQWSMEYNIPLIAGTDTHSSTLYKAECRKIVQKSKDSFYGEEDAFDLTWKTYDELVKKFEEQNAIPIDVCLKAIDNTNVFADMVEEFELDRTFKYPNLYGDNAKTIWWNTIITKLKYKIENKIIDSSKLDKYKEKIREEFKAMTKQGMESFMMFMSELVDFCREKHIPYGPRGSVCGSVIAYITDIIDVDPIVWNTVFSRFCNADRISLADIDIDFAPEDRVKIYEYITKRFGNKNVAYILTMQTIQDRGSIDVLAKGLDYKDLEHVAQIKDTFDDIFKRYAKIIQEEVNLEELEGAESKSPNFGDHELYIKTIRNPKQVCVIQNLKQQWDKLREDNQKLFYYFDGIKGTYISKGSHPAGMIGSPITLFDNLGVFYKGGDENIPISFCSMKAVDYLNYVKFDILGLKTIGILKDTYELNNKAWEYSHEINWKDEKVWNDMNTSRVGVFQFEGEYAFELLSQFQCQSINDMSLVNASLRPSGKSYRDRLINREFNQNPSKEIDDLLKDNNGFLVFQEDTIKFLTDICGFSGSHADNVRRAIGKKDYEALKKELPLILDGYCKISKKDRLTAEKEAKKFIQIVDDSAEYQFGYNHATGYSMNGYRSVRERYYTPLQFTTAYLNRAEDEKDISNGMELVKVNNITINPPKFRFSRAKYMCEVSSNSIYKGIESIKFLNAKVAEELYNIRYMEFNCFIDLLHYMKKNTSIDYRQLNILTKLNYFNEFGKNQKLLHIIETYEKKLKNKKLKETTVETRLNDLKIIEKDLENKSLNIKEQIKAEMEYYGYEVTTIPNLLDSIYIITEIDTKYTPKLRAYNLKTGALEVLKCKKKDINKNPFGEFSILNIHKIDSRNKTRCVNGDWVVLDEKEKYLLKWEIIM